MRRHFWQRSPSRKKEVLKSGRRGRSQAASASSITSRRRSLGRRKIGGSRRSQGMRPIASFSSMVRQRPVRLGEPQSRVEADALQLPLALQEEPVEPEEDPLARAGELPEPPANALNDGGLAGAVRAVEEDHLVDPALPGEALHEAVELRLGPLLADQDLALRLPEPVEDLEALRLLAHPGAGPGAEVLDHLEHVLRRGAEVEVGVAVELLQELREGLDAARPAIRLEAVILDFLEDVAQAHSFRLVYHWGWVLQGGFGCPGSEPEQESLRL